MSSEAEERAFIWRLARRVPADEPIRKLAEPLLRGQAVRAEHLGAAIAEAREPSMRRWRRLVVALWALGQAHLPTEQSAPLVAPLCCIMDGGEPKDLGGQAAAWCIGAALVPGAAMGISFAASSPDGGVTRGWDDAIGILLGAVCVTAMMAIFGAAVFAPVCVPLSVAVDRRRLVRARALSARALGRWAEPEAVGALARAARSRNARLRAEARPALRRTLDALTPDCYGRLSAQDQLYLLPLLSEVDEPLAVAALEALGYVGGGAVVDCVRALAGEVTHWKDASGSRVIWPRTAGLSPAIREAAARVLPHIEERARRERDKGVLLRAATAAPDQPLLRPAGPSANEPEVLLRSVGEEGAPE